MTTTMRREQKTTRTAMRTTDDVVFPHHRGDAILLALLDRAIDNRREDCGGRPFRPATSERARRRTRGGTIDALSSTTTMMMIVIRRSKWRRPTS
jgi:hypothetical protein